VTRRLLVTGAAGLIGSELIRSFDAAAEVVAVSRSRPLAPEATVRWIVRDLAESGWTEDLPDGVDTVVHLAQSRQFRQFPEGAPDVFAVNVASTAALLDWARRSGVRRFVLGSSGGIGDVSPSGSAEPVGNPLGFYLASKRAAELLAEAYTAVMTVVVLRFFFVYGPDQRPTMFLPRLVRSVREGQPVTLHGPSGLYCNPVHVSDAARALGRAAELEESETLSVAGPDVASLRSIAETIGKALGTPPVFHTAPADGRAELVGDVARMSTLLGPPRVRLDDGLAELCARFGPGD